MGTLIFWTPLNFNESLIFIHITFCLMLFVCLSSTTLALALSICKLIVEIEWPLTLTFDSELGNRFNLSNQVRDRSLLGYDIGINVLLIPPTVSNSLKRLRGCHLRGEF